MSKKVYANGMEISGKATSNKSVAAMPDVCLSPPAPPAGPIPIPYPNTSMASDTTGGSKSVKIKGKEIGLKNKSKYKKSNGDQPATRNFGANIMTHNLTGPTKFVAWSFNVKVEGKNVTRFGDLTTHNHSNPSGGALTSSLAIANEATEGENPCQKLDKANQEARKEMNAAKQKRKTKTKEKPEGEYLDHKGLTDTATGNHTITHAIFTPQGGQPEIRRAASTMAAELYDDSFSKYPGMRSGESAMNEKGCGPHKYKPFGIPHTCHTEARIIEEIFKADQGKGGKLVLAINWPNPPLGKNPTSLCVECQKLVCAAVKPDGCLTITRCNQHGKEVDACP